jgi:hypothetical protein
MKKAKQGLMERGRIRVFAIGFLVLTKMKMF